MGTSLRTQLVLGALLLGGSTGAEAQSISGRLLDSRTGLPVVHARVEAMAPEGAIIQTVDTGDDGVFAVPNLVPGLRYRLRIARIGYFAATVGPFEPGTPNIVVELQPAPIPVNPIVVTASRETEAVFESPASVSVVGREEIEFRPTTTAADHIRSLQGVDIVSAGMIQHNIVARGFNNVASGATLLMTDHRYAGVPSLRLNTYYLLPLGAEDLDQVEIVRGPGTALYGPNSAAGVIHFRTRSAFEAPGTRVSVGLGERALRQLRLRHSQRFSDRVALRVSADLLQGDDWTHVDPQEATSRTIALARGANPDTLLVGLRDNSIERVTGDFRADIRVSNEGTLTLSGGTARAVNNIDLTEIGAAQVQGWSYSFTQARFQSGNLFAQAFINSSDAGDTYLLRTGQPIVDNSKVFVAQIKTGTDLGSNEELTYGVDYQRTNPRTGGTINGRNEADDDITEAGAYLQSESSLTPRLRLIAALRFDYHSRLDNLTPSPRAALVFKPSQNHMLRLSYNRAFTTPSTNNLFVDIIADSLAPLPFAIRASGVPDGGFTYRKNCAGGLCMRSPFNPNQSGGSQAFLPTDATLVWNGWVSALRQTGIDLSAIPAPAPDQVGTNVGLLNATTGQFEPIGNLEDIPELKSKITNSVELGYRGLIGPAVMIEVDLWGTRINDFLGPLRFESPSVLFDRTDLEGYLANFMSPSEAALVAAVASRAPAGTVTPNEAPDPTDLLLTYRNFGDVTLFGADLGLAAFLSPHLAVRASYSWTSDDFFPAVDDFADIALNAPRNKGSLTGTYFSGSRNLVIELAGRFVGGFPVSSGVFVGQVDSYSLIDVTGSWRLPFDRSLQLSVTAQNALDNRHRQFVGAPEIGRLVLGRLKAEF